MCFSSRTEGKTEPPDYVKDRMPGFLDSVDAIAQQQAPVYAGMRTAPLNPYQTTAGQMAADRALYSDPQTLASRGALTGIASGGAMNPYASNPYTNAMISGNAKDMADAFATGTAANTDAMASRAGAFGGSAHQELASRNAGELAKQVGNMANTVRFGQNNLAAQLHQQDIGNIMQAAGMAPAFSMLDSQSIDQMGQYGNQLQQYGQGLLDEGYSTWQGEQEWPFRMADWLGGQYARASGGYGESFGRQSQNPLGLLARGLFGL